MEAGSRDGAFEMYLRYIISNRVIPSDKSAEDILREHFWHDRGEYEGWCQTVEDLRNSISMICDEAYRGLIGDLPEKFLEKYFTPDVMMELLEEQFRLLGDSGEGKSLLLKLLAVYFREHNIPFDTVDWNTSEEALWDRLNGNTLKLNGSYLLYDNGDITLTPEVYSKLIELPCTSIISMKRIQRVDCGLYDVIYNPGDLRVEKYL